MKRQLSERLLCLLPFSLRGRPSLAGQPSPQIPLQHIVFKDNVLPNFIQMFAAKKKTAVRVKLQEAEEGYTCHLSEVHFLNDIIDHPPTRWAAWKSIVMVFDSDWRTDSIFQITDSTSVTNLASYVEPFLQKLRPSIRIGNVIELGESIPIEGLEWRFKVKNGREEWSCNNRGFDSRDIPPLPPTRD